MNTTKSFMLSLAFLGLSGFADISPNRRGGPAVSSPQAEGADVALLIGINQYPNLPPDKQLRGCVNDVLLVQKLLIERFKFKPGNIKTLLNQEATRANIQKQFEEFLIKNAAPQKQAVFYFSGHGGKMTDLNSDEMDHFDETLVTYNSRDKARRVLDIEDETLGQWLVALTNKCKNVTVILDCCHSGSGTRGGLEPTEARARIADTLFLSVARTTGAGSGSKGPSGFLPPNPNYVLVSGSRDNEFSWESGANGALTVALNEVMRNTENMTYREMMYKVGELVTGGNPYQHPQIEGGRSDATVFGNLGKVERFLAVVKKEEKQVQLNGGTAHNVTAGSVYALYKPGTTNRDDSSRYLGQAKITKVGAFTAWAEIRREKSNIIPNAAAFEISHHYGAQQLPVRLTIKNDPSLLAEIQQTLAQYKGREDLVTMAADTQKYAVKIQLSPDKKSLLFLGPEGRVKKIIARDTLKVSQHLPDILTKMARWRNLFELKNRSSELKVSITLQRWEGYDAQARTPINPLATPKTAGGERVLYDQDIINVTLKNFPPKPVYFYLLDLGTDGSVSYLYPGKGAQDSPIASSDSVISFAFRASLPEGLDALKLIATTAPTDFSVLVQAGYRSATERSTSKSGLDSPLGRLLNLAYGGKRNIEALDPTPIDDWTTDMVAFLIRAKDSGSQQ